MIFTSFEFVIQPKIFNTNQIKSNKQNKFKETVNTIYPLNFGISLIIIALQSMSSKAHSPQKRSRDKSISKPPQIMFYPQQEKFSPNLPLSNLPNRQPFKSFTSASRQPQSPLEVKRKSSQINTLHEQYNSLKHQMKKMPQKNISIEGDIFVGGKQKSQQFYAQDEKQLKSQSSQQPRGYRKTAYYLRKHQSNGEVQYSKNSKERKDQDNQFSHKPKVYNYKRSEVYQNISKQSRQKDSSSSSQVNTYFNKNNASFQSSPPLPYKKRSFQVPSEGPVKKSEIVSQKEQIKLSPINRDRSTNLKDKVQRFSIHLTANMGNILKKHEDLQKKYISLDLYMQELKECLRQKRKNQSPKKQILQLKQRQFKFLIGQQEAKVKQLKAENQRLEKEVLLMRMKQQQSRSQIRQSSQKLRSAGKVVQSYQQLKRTKHQANRKLIQYQQRISNLQKQKNNLQVQLQRQKSKKHYDLENSTAKEEVNISHFISNSTLFGPSQDADYLRQQISKFQYQNKQYQKLLSIKSTQISNLNRSCTETKMILQKIKQLNQQLQKQCDKLRRESIQKQVEATQKMCNLNNTIKKKLKQYDSFKDLIVECLDQIYKKAPKKIRKLFDAQLANKNRTMKCEVMFKCANSSFTYYEDQISTLLDVLLKEFSISSIEIEKLGLQVCMKKVKQEMNSSVKAIEALKIDNKTLVAQIQKLKEQVTIKTQQITSLRQQQQNMLLKKRSLKDNKKDIIPTNDFDPRQSITSSEIGKKKVEIQKLNRQNNRLIEESHQKYLKYQEQIANLQIKQKQYNSKLLQLETQRKQLQQRLHDKQMNYKAIQKSIYQLKMQRDNQYIKITELNNQSKKQSIQYQNKLHKLQSQIQSLNKKIKKMKSDSEANEKAFSSKIAIKDKAINELLEQKKKSTVQSKILTEKLQFAKIMEEAKQKQPPKKIQIPLRLNQQQKQYFQTKISNLNQQIITQGEEIKNLSTIIKSINITLSEKEKLLQKTQFELRRKEQQIDNNIKQSKQKELRKHHISQEYKKIVQDIKREKQELQIKYEQQKDKRTKEVYKTNKLLQFKQEEITSLNKQKSQQSNKSKQLQLKMSQLRRENEELINLIHKKQKELQEKQNQSKQQRQAYEQLHSKNMFLQKQLIQRQQYFKKSQILMQQLINQNQQSKEELAKKQQQILELIKQRQELNFRLSQDLDAKSQNLKITRFNHQNELILLREQLQATQMNLQTTKQQLKIKNNLITQLKQKQNSNKKEPSSSSKQSKQHYEAQINECKQQIQNLTNKIDILQEQIQQTKNKLQDRQQQLDNAKRQKNKYYQAIQKNQTYIEQLEQGFRIKCNEVDQMKQYQQEYEQIRQEYEQNQQKLKAEIEQLKLTIKQLQDKSIQTVNKLKKQISQYKQQIQQLKENIVNETRKKKSIMSEKEQLTIDNKKKQTQIMNLLQKYQDLKIKAIENRQLPDFQEERQQVQSRHNEKNAIELQQKKIQIEAKNHQIQVLQGQLKLLHNQSQKIDQFASRIVELQLSLKQLSSYKIKFQQIAQQKQAIVAKQLKLQVQLADKSQILQHLNMKIQNMDSQINDLEIKLDQSKLKNKELLAKLQSARKTGQHKSTTELQEQLQQKQRELDEKDYKIEQIKQQHRKALKQQLNQYNSNLQSYRSNYTILQKQLNTYKQVNIVLTQKCQSLEKEYLQLQKKKYSHSKNILTQSPNHLDFASVQFDLPQKQHILRNLLSESQQNRLSIICQVVNQKIQIQEVPQSSNHHYDQPFQLCEQSNFSWPSLQIRENNDKLIRSQYLQRLQNQIHQMLANKEQSFGPSFYNLHSNSGLDILNCIQYQLIQYKTNMKDQMLEELQFIDNHQVDFCQNLQQEIQEFVYELQQRFSININQRELQKQVKQWQHEKEMIQLNALRQCHKYKEDIRISQQNRQKLIKELSTLSMQFKLQQSQIQELVDKKQEEIQEQERYFMSQSQILRKELAKENARADKNQCNYLTVKKAIEKLLEILSDKQDKSEELQDAFQHIAKICDEKDEKLKKSMEQYLNLYSEEQERKKNSRESDQKGRKKKGFFGFA